MRLFIFIFFIALASILGTGCGTYRLVQVNIDTDLATKPEITTVPQIGKRISNSKNVVISYSSEFYDGNEKPADTTVLMRSRGIWITEIEREFVKKGFRVLSRQKYNELLREKGVKASKEVANLLGADLIIQINSLEYSDHSDINDRSEKKYQVYLSNSVGLVRQKARRPEEIKQLLKQTKAFIAEDVDEKAYMGLLDCKIIDAKTGELIIFYRNQLFQLRGDRQPNEIVSYLYRLKDKKWELVNTKGLKARKTNILKPTLNRSKAMEIKLRMVKAVVEDFVTKINNFRQ